MNSKPSCDIQNYRPAAENTRQWISSTGLIRLVGRGLSRLLSGLNKDAMDIIQAVKDVWNGPELDPKRYAKTPPKWWNRKVDAIEVPDQGEYFEPKEGGFAVGFDGSMMYSTGQTAQERQGWSDVSKQAVITPEEYGQMVAYKVSARQTGLFNVNLAARIKPYYLQGKRPGEIAVLIGEKSESLVRQYCICFERAKTQGHSPTEKTGHY